MELTYILVLEVLAVIVIFKFFTGWAGASIILLALLMVWFFTSRKNILIYTVPLLLMLRIVFAVHSGEYEHMENTTMDVEINRGRGKVIKIDDRYPKRKTFFYISELADGQYKIIGKITDIEDKKFADFITVKEISETKIEKNWIEKYFEEKTKDFTDNGNSKFKSVYRAVVLGESSKLNKDLRWKFNYTGVSHLMALSGLHIGIILGTTGFILKRFPLKREVSYILMLALLTIYFMGVKHSPSLIRAYIMGVIFICGKLFYENTEVIKSLAVSFIIGVFFNPTSVDEISFRLSYLAVFAIGGVYPLVIEKIYKGNSKLIKNLILVSVIQLFLAPIIIKEFGNIQFLSFFSNLIILPLGTMYITAAFIGLLFSNIGLGTLVFPIVNILYKIFIESVEFFSKLPYLTLKYDGNRESSIFLLFYVIISGIVFYNKIKMEGKRNETIYKRTKILK